MIWFNIKELEQKLKSELLTNQETFYYLLANLIFYSLAPYLADHDEPSWWLTIEAALAVAITLIGTKEAFDINSRGDDKDFLQRYLSLSFVITIRLLVFVCILAIPLGIFQAVGKDLLEVDMITGRWFDVLITVAISIIFYFMLLSSFKRVALNSN